MATLSVLALVTIVTGLLLVVTNRSMFELRQSGRSRDKQMALSLAEAGVDDTVERLRGDWAYTGGSGSLSVGVNGANAVGSFSTTITEVNPQIRKVISRGTNPNGTKTSVVVLVQRENYHLGDAAIKANKNADIGGTADVVTQPLHQHIADVYSNSNIYMGSNSTVDGTLYAQGVVSGPSYETGQVYAPSVSGAPPIYFPSPSEVAAIKSKLITDAQARGTTIGTVKKTMTITAPAYINGDIQLSSYDVVTIVGPGVVYVAGDIRLSGQSKLINGATVGVGGTFVQTGGTVYQITTGHAETPTLAVFNTYNSSPGVTLVGGADSIQQGIIWANTGGIKVAGGSVFVGALVAGGSNGEVSVNGNYRHIYPENMHSRIEFPGEARVIFWGETK